MFNNQQNGANALNKVKKPYCVLPLI